MQNTPYQHLAKEFMDLWQKQVATVISDKQFIHAMLELFQSIQTPGHDKPNAAPAHPAHAADAEPGLLAEFAFRLAMCEKRLAALEQQHKKPASKSGAATTNIRMGNRRGSKKPRH